MNSANRLSYPMTKMTFHRPAGSRIHGLFSSRQRPLMKRCYIYASTRRISTSTTSDVSASSSWFPGHLQTDKVTERGSKTVLDYICYIWHIREVLKGVMKPLIFVADSRRALAEFPKAVQQQVGFALYQAQMGGKHIDAKPLKNVGAGVLEVVSDHRGDTFRTVYTVKLEKAVFVLHAFQKKSKHGIATPKSVLELVKQRLERAIEIDRELEK